MKTRWKCQVEYDGTPFVGWQKQPGLDSVQSRIEDAIAKFCQQDIDICVAGRTDAGVHAHGQVFHFDLDYGDRPLTGFDLAKAINAHLRPAPIAILDARPVSDDFHARFDAVNKQYCYRVISRPAPLVMDMNRAWYVRHQLDLTAMQQGAVHLIGHHDFSTFRDSQCQAKTPMRTLDICDITAHPYHGSQIGGSDHNPDHNPDHNNDSHHDVKTKAWPATEYRFVLEGQSFIHHQVRNIVGTLLLVGQGKWAPIDIKTALAAKNRTQGGPTAPAWGLSLMRIDYALHDTKDLRAGELL